MEIKESPGGGGGMLLILYQPAEIRKVEGIKFPLLGPFVPTLSTTKPPEQQIIAPEVSRAVTAAGSIEFIDGWRECQGPTHLFSH